MAKPPFLPLQYTKKQGFVIVMMQSNNFAINFITFKLWGIEIWAFPLYGTLWLYYIHHFQIKRSYYPKNDSVIMELNTLK